MTHTEAPWLIRKSAHYKLDGVSHREIIIDPDGEEGGIVIGEVFYSDTGDDEAEANARLIAAAPELLEACVEFVRRVEAGEIRSKLTYATMKAVIAKAKGE